MSRNVLRKVTLASGCEIAVSVALTVDVFALSREERNFVFEMIDQLAKIEREVARPSSAFEPLVLDKAKFLERDPVDVETDQLFRGGECYESMETFESMSEPPALTCTLLETMATAVRDEPLVPSWPTVTVKRESIAEKTAAAPALKPSGAIVDSAKNLDAFRAAAKDRRDKLAKEAARAKERLAAARARTEELEAQRKARQGRCSVAPPERDPVLARANREKLPERNELPVPSSTWVL